MRRPRRGLRAHARIGSAFVLSALVGLILIAADRHAPTQYLPWKAFSFAAPPGPATRMQTNRLGADYAGCQGILDGADIAHVAAASVSRAGFCDISDSVQIKAGAARLSPSAAIMRCPRRLAQRCGIARLCSPLQDAISVHPLL